VQEQDSHQTAIHRKEQERERKMCRLGIVGIIIIIISVIISVINFCVCPSLSEFSLSNTNKFLCIFYCVTYTDFCLLPPRPG
jgi:hypothetical protein